MPLRGPLPGSEPSSDTLTSDQQTKTAQPTLPPTQYDVTVVTGDKFGAGTDAVITCVIVGTLGKATHTFDQVCLSMVRTHTHTHTHTHRPTHTVSAHLLWDAGQGKVHLWPGMMLGNGLSLPTHFFSVSTHTHTHAHTHSRYDWHSVDPRVLFFLCVAPP